MILVNKGRLAETSYELLQAAGWVIQQDLQSARFEKGFWFSDWYVGHAGTGRVEKFVLASTHEPNEETWRDAADEFVDILAGWPTDDEEDKK
jgi:hypothetical protein